MIGTAHPVAENYANFLFGAIQLEIRQLEIIPNATELQRHLIQVDWLFKLNANVVIAAPANLRLDAELQELKLDLN